MAAKVALTRYQGQSRTGLTIGLNFIRILATFRGIVCRESSVGL